MTEKGLVESATVRAHRRQLVWQILIPFLVMAGVVVAAAVRVVSAGPARARLWADVSIIWLIAPMLVLALVVMAVLALAIFGLARLLQVAPRYTARVQAASSIAAVGVRKAADGVAAPYVWFEQAKAALKSIFGL
jgi:hypothetical protein